MTFAKDLEALIVEHSSTTRLFEMSIALKRASARILFVPNPTMTVSEWQEWKEERLAEETSLQEAADASSRASVRVEGKE